MIKKMGDELAYMGPDEFKKFLQSDYQIYTEIAKMIKK